MLSLDIDNLIFTKLDETKSFGNVISFSHRTKKSITYFSIGQKISCLELSGLLKYQRKSWLMLLPLKNSHPLSGFYLV
jgi:hypothetical protein